MEQSKKLISIVIPCHNEAANIDAVYASLTRVMAKTGYKYECIYIDDGSRDDTLHKLQALAAATTAVTVLALPRNFGKEIAVSAGLQHAHGKAVIMLDGDGQFPAELIPVFIEKWEAGAPIVTGLREANQGEGIVKRYGSKLFYSLFNRLAGLRMVARSTDFRLIDRSVQREFVQLTEHDRITRGLIDWLGFPQVYVPFTAHARTAGGANYSFSKLLKLALNSFVSLSLKPLYFSFYLGLIVLPLSVLLGLFSVVEMLVGDPMGLNITGTAYLVILALFLLGMVLISQGITALYLSHIHTETQNRPLYILDHAASRNLQSKH